jgi:hypothetical protein
LCRLAAFSWYLSAGSTIGALSFPIAIKLLVAFSFPWDCQLSYVVEQHASSLAEVHVMRRLWLAPLSSQILV